MRFALFTCTAAVAVSALLPAHSTAEDWPQWRGANRDGAWNEQDVVEKFPDGGPPVVWRMPVGPGYSGPTVADGRVLLTDRVNSPQQERVLCFDEQSGKKLWEHVYDCRYTISYRAGPRACVTIDGDRCYSLGAMGHLFCLNAADGKVRWQLDLNAKYKISASNRMPIWGIAAAPLIYDTLVIVQAAGADGACFVAFDKQTGEERWRALDDVASYSAPILIQQAGQDVMVGWTGDSVAGIAPGSGKVLWREPFSHKRMPIGIATPVFDGKRLFVTSFYDGSLMLELDTQRPAARRLWHRNGRDEKHTDALQSIISTPLILGDHVYGVDSYGELRCLKAEDGDRVWEDLTATPKARWSNIHFVRNGDKVWMFNERGELLIGKLSPSGFEELDRATILQPTLDQLRQRGGVCWSHPAFANRRCLVRNDKELVSVSLSK